MSEASTKNTETVVSIANDIILATASIAVSSLVRSSLSKAEAAAYRRLKEALNQKLRDENVAIPGMEGQVNNEPDLAQAEQYLDKKEKEIALIEKASRLQRRSWKYQKPADAGVWATRWIATPIAYLAPKERREEWLGDLYEGNLQLIDQGYPRWLINTINIGNTIVLVFSALSIKVSDLISSALQRQK